MPSRPAPIALRGTGSFYPAREIAVMDLVQHERPDKLFARHIAMDVGVETVHAAARTESATQLAANAARVALERAGVEAGALGLVSTVGCILPDVDVWSAAAKLAHLLDADAPECFGFGDAACAGSYAAVRALIPIMRAEEGPEQVLVAAGCIMPGQRFFPPATVFSDGAGALVLQRHQGRRKPRGPHVIRADLYSFPRYIEAFGPSAGLRRLREDGVLEKDAWTFDIGERAAYDELCDVNFDLGAQSLQRSLQRAGWAADSLRFLLPDNVGSILGPAIADRCGLPEERVKNDTTARHGHAFAADLFANLDALISSGELRTGDRVASLGMRLGQHWGVVLVEVL